MPIKNIHPFILSILSGLLLYAAWPVSPLTFLIFFAFVPLLWMENQGMKRRRFFLWVYFSMLIWNVGTTWWIINSTLPGAIGAFLANSLLMTIPWLGFYNIKKRMGPAAGYLSLLFFWLTFEYIHQHWELSWPWLTLGNVFATHPAWIQWYEFTGTTGGSFWVLSINILLVLLIKKKLQEHRWSIRTITFLIGFLILPLAISFYSFRFIFNPRSASNIVLVQPNVDPYEKFQPGEERRQVENLIRLSEEKMDTNTRLVVWPETAIPYAIEEAAVKSHPFLEPVRAFLKRHPHIRLLTGMEGFRMFDKDHQTKYTERDNAGRYYEAYNTAALMDADAVQLYHKSKLVPGVESLPSFLKFMSNWFEQFGGTTGGYARQDERTVLIADNSSYKIAPAICYESIYGEFMSQFVKNGANIICVITNDGWWGKTPGYQQHESYGRLRAIETRCWVTRSANTGISCVIDREGNVLQQLPWNVAGSIKFSVPTHEGASTFYVKHGDLISIGSIAFTILLVLWNIFVIVKARLNAKKFSVSE
jgi:apolipoprotein N-acyltransferase